VSHYGNPALDQIVAVDHAHAALLFALVMVQKPRRLLEIGMGSGKTADAILEALEYNGGEHAYTLVDSWLDFGGVMPEEVRRKYAGRITLVSADEVEFVAACRSRFDFIFSDGDHDTAEQRFERVYGELLEDGGILAYHDVANPQYPNLARITAACVERGIAHRLFARSSRPDERCERGLLVIFKSGPPSAAAG
jgi:predicted O-methyltransferase YrrM